MTILQVYASMTVSLGSLPIMSLGIALPGVIMNILLKISTILVCYTVLQVTTATKINAGINAQTKPISTTIMITLLGSASIDVLPILTTTLIITLCLVSLDARVDIMLIRQEGSACLL